MDVKYEKLMDGSNRIAYVRSVLVSDLPDDIREAAEGVDQVFAIHNADGEQLALAKDKEMAFLLARDNDFEPMSVH